MSLAQAGCQDLCNSRTATYEFSTISGVLLGTYVSNEPNSQARNNLRAEVDNRPATKHKTLTVIPVNITATNENYFSEFTSKREKKYKISIRNLFIIINNIELVKLILKLIFKNLY